MDIQLFQDLSTEERINMLDAQADEVLIDNYLRPYEQPELLEKREEYCNLSMQLAEINAEEADARAEFKLRKEPINKAMQELLGNIKQGGEYEKGKLYKIVDQEERVTGFYNEEGLLISQRKALPNEISSPTIFGSIRGNKKTGTEE